MDGAATETYGIENICLGEKTYLYISEPTDKDGNTINPEHIRCRGIPTSCTEYKASQDSITVLDIYKSI